MDPITSSVISGLVTRVLGGAAGSIPRLVKSRRQRLVREAVGDLNASAQSFLVPALAGLAERGDSTQEAVSTFLGSLEAETYVRSVAGTVISGQLKDVHVDLLDQLVALLILVAGVRREAAQDLANFLFSLFVRTIEAATERLKRTDKALYDSVSDRARSELRAGSLDGLIQRSRLLRRRDPAELAIFSASPIAIGHCCMIGRASLCPRTSTCSDGCLLAGSMSNLDSGLEKVCPTGHMSGHLYH